MSAVTKLYTFFLLTFQSTFHISDTAVSVLFSFIAMFMKLIAENYNLNQLLPLVLELPQTVIAARKILSGDRDNFSKYTCCPSCYSIYQWNNSSENTNLICSHIKHPNHTQRHHRKSCGTALMKLIKLPSQRLTHYPRLVYCYKSITESLQELLMRPNFISHCEIWRKMLQQPGMYRDVYDGQLWKDFLEPDGGPFYLCHIITPSA